MARRSSRRILRAWVKMEGKEHVHSHPGIQPVATLGAFTAATPSSVNGMVPMLAPQSEACL